MERHKTVKWDIHDWESLDKQVKARYWYCDY